MNVPLLDLQAQYSGIKKELEKALLEVARSGRYILGPQVQELEADIAEYCDAKHAVGVSSGTDALLLALMALDVGPGDWVITSPYSFFATAGAIARLGARPVFVDIDAKTYNIDPVALNQWFEDHAEDAGKVKAIIPVHLYGQCADMTPILETAAARGIAVVEDAAQALGARYPGADGLKPAGSMGDIGTYSFFPSKNLGGLGDGGMVATNNDTLAEKMAHLRNHGMNPKYHHSMIGGNFRLDALQAAVLTVKLPNLNDWNRARQDNASYYDVHLDKVGMVTPHIAYAREYHIYNQYVIAVPERRDDLREYLTAAQIGSEVYYPVPFHVQPCFAYLGYKAGDFPNSEYAAAHTIALPVYPEMSTPMQDYVIDTLKSFYK
ncbi:MAG: DegT/DnrJ/EryC1/StrS family aminotransferase [Candidatus Hydrogenedentes bacterium]|nr:DegT/DnrJ/EryC1/StrS family aminotransferase [Candidatus Hydrogenedentota bacterium]